MNQNLLGSIFKKSSLQIIALSVLSSNILAKELVFICNAEIYTSNWNQFSGETIKYDTDTKIMSLETKITRSWFNNLHKCTETDAEISCKADEKTLIFNRYTLKIQQDPKPVKEYRAQCEIAKERAF